MKRATKGHLTKYRGTGTFFDVEEVDDILDSDARQRAEIRRLRAALRALVTSDIPNWGHEDQLQILENARAALRPAKRGAT